MGHTLPSDYTQFLKANALKGARIGVDDRFITDPTLGVLPGMQDVTYAALGAMTAFGATLVATTFPRPLDFFNDEFWVLVCEFKDDIATYLGGLNHTSMRTLADLIAFDSEHCWLEMRYFGQELFEIADSTGGVQDSGYAAARANCLALCRDPLDALLENYDAIVAPHWSWISSVAAVAGYPNLAVPIGITTEGFPLDLCIVGGFLQEPTVLALGYSLEQLLHARTEPQYLGQLPTRVDAGICQPPPGKRVGQDEMLSRLLKRWNRRGPRSI